MSHATLHVDGPVSIVTLNRPERLNAIGGTLLGDLHDALVRAHADPATRMIVFTGAGRAFCAGADLKEFDEQSSSAQSIAETCERIQRITRDIMFGPKLVIGAVQGYAVGGGLEWVLNCDLVVAADDLVAFFPEMSLGHFVTGGATHLLPRRVGHQRAMELMVLGERHDAQALLRLGIVNRVVPRAGLMTRALEVAHQAAARSTLATQQLKRAVVGQFQSQLSAALAMERAAAEACFASADTAQRIAAHTVRRR